MPKTLRLRVEEPGAVEAAAAILQRGGLVAFATETVYGLGGNALSPGVVSQIFRAKRRPAWDPLIVHIASVEDVPSVARVGNELYGRVRLLAEAFWPGPLTLLLPRQAEVPDVVTAGRELVGVRVPAHPAALALLRGAGVPVAAPSANRFGHTSPTTADHVLDDLAGRIDAVLDAGPCAVGLESTVVDPGTTPMTVYRAGAVTREALEDACDVPAQMFAPASGDANARPESVPSPGVGVRHYAPDAELRLTSGTPDGLWAEVCAVAATETPVGVLLPEDWAQCTDVDCVLERWGRWDDVDSLAAGLFAGLRALESKGVQVMVCPLPEPGGLRDALRDRLGKAARAR